MDHAKKQSVGSSSSSSSSSFTENLFGPKDTSSSGLFTSVFGPSSTGHSSNSKNQGSSSKLKELYGSSKSLTPTADYKQPQRMMGGHQNETAEPSCYLSSSIYYGGQEAVYSPNTRCPPHTFKKDEGDTTDPNGTTASRGNWWQGSLYY